MTVSTTTSRWEYDGDGVSTVFPYDNRIFATNDMKVYVGGALHSSGYTVTGVDQPSGGTVVFSVPPPAGTKNVVLVRDVPALQPTAYPPNDRFPSSAHERALDRVTVLVQQILSVVGRSLRLQEGDAAAPLWLPTLAERAGKFLGFDANGIPVPVAGTDTAPDLSDRTVLPAGATHARSLRAKLGELVSVRDFGAVGDGIADDTAAIQAAVDQGGHVRVPRPSVAYRITARILASVPGTTIEAEDGAEIRQDTAGVAGIVVAADNVTIRGLYLNSPQPKTGSTASGPYRGGIHYHSGVLQIEGNHLLVEKCTFLNWTTGIGHHGTQADTTTLARGGTVRHCVFIRHDFGILARQFDGFTIEGNEGYDCEDTTNNPPHLVYITDRGVTRSRGLIVADNREINNTSSSAYKIRNVDGVSVTGNIASGCPRGVEIGTCTDVVVSGNVVDNIINNPLDTQQGAFGFADCERVKVVGNTVNINPGVNCFGFRLREDVGPSNRLVELINNTVTATWTVETTFMAVQVIGFNDVDIINLQFVNMGFVTPIYPIRIDSGTRVRIVNPRLFTNASTTNAERLVQVLAGGNATYVQVDTRLWTTWSATASVSDGGTASVIRTNGAYNAAGALVAPVGSQASPGVAFDGDAAKGLYRGAGMLAVAVDGATPIYWTTNSWRPGADNAVTVGTSALRPSVYYGVTGAINTSDAREKLLRSSLTEAELRAAGRISRSVVVYQWLSSLAAKGQAARLHVGPTAQAVAEAFAAEGLDAARYALWCSDDLYELVKVGTDDDGNPIMAEVPVLDGDGRQMTRQGLRPDQLVLFLLAAQVARMDALESRLAALEA